MLLRMGKENKRFALAGKGDGGYREDIPMCI